MNTVAVIGEGLAVHSWALAGVRVCAAGDPSSVRRAWRELAADVAVVLLTPAAADVLAAELAGLTWPLAVVIPA